MIKYSFKTIRSSTAIPFFINTPEGVAYETIMIEARSVRPTSEAVADALLDFNRIESSDGLEQTTTYTFNSSVGKDALFNDFGARYTANNMVDFQSARTAYNQTNNQTTSLEVNII